jgi:hypothetical protein
LIHAHAQSFLDSHALLVEDVVSFDGSNTDSLYLPLVSSALLEKIKSLSIKMAGPVQEEHIAQVLYFLQELQVHRHLQGVVMLVMSEFAVQHPSTQSEIVELLVTNLEQDLTNRNSSHIEGCILGLSNILQSKPELLNVVVEKILKNPLPSEGFILALQYFAGRVKDDAVTCSAIVAKFMPMMNSPRVTESKRLYALLLAGIFDGMFNFQCMFRLMLAVKILSL